MLQTSLAVLHGRLFCDLTSSPDFRLEKLMVREVYCYSSDSVYLTDSQKDAEVVLGIDPQKL